MADLTPAEAYAAVLDGKVIRVEVGEHPDDPVLLNYLDDDGYGEQAIYTEAIGGWSQGVKEAVCESDSTFYAEKFLTDRKSITLTDEEPFMRGEHLI